MADWKNYPKQIRSILRRGKTLGVDAELYTPIEDNPKDNSPLEMHSGFSRFVFTLIDKDKSGNVVINKANIPANEISYIKKKTELAMQVMDQMSLSGSSDSKVASGPAYNQKLLINGFKGKTPAEILSADPSQATNLLKGKAWLEANLAKYPNNKGQINAIDEGIKLLKEGKLSKDVSTASFGPIEIYKVDFKPFTEKDEAGRRRIYGISIYCDPSKNYPFYININNCYAPVGRAPNGALNIAMSQAVNTTKSYIGLSALEWYSLIDRADSTIKLFEEMNFEKQFKISMKYAYQYAKSE